MKESIYTIINQCKTGNRKAQLELYSAFSRRIYNSCYRILKNSFEAENAMQESFLKVFSNIDSYDISVPFEAWITRIAINTSIDALRKIKEGLIELNENMKIDVLDDYENEEWDHILEQVEQVKTAIDKLPDNARLIITLYLIEGYDHEEIGEILGIQTGTARVQYMRAKQKLIETIKAA